MNDEDRWLKDMNQRLNRLEDMQEKISRIVHHMMRRMGMIDEDNHLIEEDEDEIHYIS
jgi:hypothetical protein